MARWSVYRDSEGVPVEIAEVHELEYHGEHIGEDDEYVIVKTDSAFALGFRYGDYIVYRGQRFTIDYNQSEVKRSRRGTYGEAFSYDYMKFFSDARKLRHIIFRDVVLGNTDIVHSSLGKFSFYAQTIDDLADRIQANLKRATGEPWTIYQTLTEPWKVFTPNRNRTNQRLGQGGYPTDWDRVYGGYDDSLSGSSLEGDSSNSYNSHTAGKTEQNVKCDNINCHDAVSLGYTLFGVKYDIIGRNVVFEPPTDAVSKLFRYGKGHGLREIEMNVSENDDVATKLYAYGSERNLPLNYYAYLHKKAYLVGEKYINDKYIVGGNLLFKTDMAYSDLTGSFSNSDFSVMLQNGNYKCSGRAIHSEFYDDDNPNKLYIDIGLYRDIDPENPSFYNPTLANFWNSLESGTINVYVAGGIDINLWPSAYIEQEGDFPSLLAVNRLMLPGFPDMSLYDWITTPIAEGGGGGIAINNSTGKAYWNGYKAFFSKDAHDPWVMSIGSVGIGIREKSIYFDNEEDGDIYPTIEGTDFGEVLHADEVEDNGYPDSMEEETYEFNLIPKGDYSGIDWNDNDGNLSIQMKDGACVGREFKVKKAEKKEVSDRAWVLTLERSKDESTERYYPYKEELSNTLFQVKGSQDYQTEHDGDHFIALGLNLQSGFVKEASKKLLEASLKSLYEHDHPTRTCIPKIDELFMQRQDDKAKVSGGTIKSIHDTIRAGMQVCVVDSDLKLTITATIKNLTIKENGNNGIPTYEMVIEYDDRRGGMLGDYSEDYNDYNHIDDERDDFLTDWKSAYNAGGKFTHDYNHDYNLIENAVSSSSSLESSSE